MHVRIQNFAAMRVAFVRHVGPYPQGAGAWDRLLPRLGSQGRLGAGTLGREPRSAPCVEVYLRDPDSTEPEDLVTEIRVALEERKRR